LRAVLIAALLVVSGRCQSQDAMQDAAHSGQAQDNCSSVVLVRCGQPAPQPKPVQVDAPRTSPRTTRQRLDARRLQQMQAQVGLNAIEITGERPPNLEPERWENFRQVVSNAALPGCFAPNALSHEEFVLGGLLGLPFWVHAAVVGKCR
jgi:hypothetical protein